MIKLVLVILSVILFVLLGLGLGLGSLNLLAWGLACLALSFIPWRE